VLADRHAEGGALLRVAQRRLEGGLGQAHRRRRLADSRRAIELGQVPGVEAPAAAQDLAGWHETLRELDAPEIATAPPHRPERLDQRESVLTRLEEHNAQTVLRLRAEGEEIRVPSGRGDEPGARHDQVIPHPGGSRSEAI